MENNREQKILVLSILLAREAFTVIRNLGFGRYGSMKVAAKQVDLLMRGNMDLCVNIVQVGRQFEVRAIAWQ